jgi:GNAT superfamily N-acetyltransferase
VPPLDSRLVALLGRVWPALPPAIARAEALGYSWAAVSTPFMLWEGTRVVAHVGVIELPLVVGGRQRTVASLHAVCTDPERRGRGYADAVMQAALAHCRVRYGTVILTTLIPGFYARHGFRAVSEHAHARAVPARVPRGGGRRLSEAPEDVRLLRRLLAQRVPVSERLGALERGAVFAFALLLTRGGFTGVHYHPGLDVATVHEVVGRTLVLYDVVGAAIPPVPALLDAVGADVDRLVTLFVPDRLGDGFAPEPWDPTRAESVGDGGFAGLMARGPLDPGTPTFMLPPLART